MSEWFDQNIENRLFYSEYHFYHWLNLVEFGLRRFHGD